MLYSGKNSKTTPARCQSSVTRGAEKKIWGAQINFTLIFEREDQKRSSSSPFTFFRGDKSRSGRVYCRARRDLMVRISLLAQKFSGEHQKKKVFGAKSSASLGVKSCISFWIEISLTFGGHKQFFWGHRTRNALQ